MTTTTDMTEGALALERLEVDAREQVAQDALDRVDLVGLQEIAFRLGKAPGTAHMWHWRAHQAEQKVKPAKTEWLPEPRLRISGVPLWSWPLDIVPWAESTGRINT